MSIGMDASAAARVVAKKAADVDLLAALERAPARAITDEERALLAELAGRPVRWIDYEELVTEGGPHDDPR